MQISTAIGVSAWNHCVFECFAFLFGASDILTHTISYPYASFAPGCEKWIGIVAISQTLNMVSFSLRAEWQEPVFTNCTHACFDRHYISTDLGTFFFGKIVFHRISSYFQKMNFEWISRIRWCNIFWCAFSSLPGSRKWWWLPSMLRPEPFQRSMQRCFPASFWSLRFALEADWIWLDDGDMFWRSTGQLWELAGGWSKLSLKAGSSRYCSWKKSCREPACGSFPHCSAPQTVWSQPLRRFFHDTTAGDKMLQT